MFIQPPLVKNQAIYPPLGIGYLAAYSEKVGHTVRILDSTFLNYGIHDIRKEIKRFDPDVVGITAMTQNINNAMSIVSIAKENNHNCMTVLGGSHPTATAKNTLEKNLNVDVIVRGEGEETFIELLEKKENLTKIRGITYRLNGRIFENQDRKLIENLDILPFPAYHLLPMKKYKERYKIFGLELFVKIGAPFSTISASRGCPYNCIFCASRALWGEKWRTRSPENVIEELRFLTDKYNIKLISFADDTFTINKKRVERICELIKKEDIDLNWTCLTRVELCSKNIVYKLKNAGCYAVGFGFESGVQKTLDFLCKGFGVEDSIRAVRKAKEGGLQTAGNFIIGIPGETKEMINQTIAFANKLDLMSATFTLLTPFPGTRIYEIAEEKNLLLTKDWSEYTMLNPVMNVPGFSTRELKNLLLKCNFGYKLKRLSKFISLKRDH